MIFGISILGVVFLSTLSLRRATPAWLPYFPMEQRFLSTLSLRRATSVLAASVPFFPSYFYPRSPCGERPSLPACLVPGPDFYPRSPCGERRVVFQVVLFGFGHFYPRSPCGERYSQPPGTDFRTDFYPRSPCGERLPTPLMVVILM